MLKNITTTFLLLLLGNVLFSQSLIEKAKANKEPIFEEVDQLAVFPGGNEALIKFIGTNMRYPKTDKVAGLEGKVVIKFVIETDGQITLIRRIENTTPAMLEESIRLMYSMPKWTPAQKNGQTVRSWISLPIKFELGK